MTGDPSKIVLDGYDAIASVYHHQRDRFRNQAVLARVAQYLPDKGHVLDIGCGAGIPVSQFFLDKGYAVTGIDTSGKMLDLARIHLAHATLLQKSMTDLDFPDRSFDGVVCCYALFHVPRTSHQSILENVYRLLKPGGAILLSVGTTAWEGVEDFHGTAMYWSHYAPSAYQSMITAIGFETISAEAIDDGTETHFWFIGRKAP